MEEELRAVKELGFNMLRKHVKWNRPGGTISATACILVWQDMVSGGKPLATLEQMMALAKIWLWTMGTWDDEEESYRLIVRDRGGTGRILSGSWRR